MRKRYQKGSLKKVGASWVGQWWEEGHRRNKTLGRVSEMTKSEARSQLADILAPVNKRFDLPSGQWEFGDFIRQVYLPFYKRKWKDSTARTNEDRIRYHVISQFDKCRVDSFTRDGLQDFLDQKAAAGLSFSTVDHLRWDLKQIFDLAVAEGHLQRNPATLLFTPREAHRPAKPRMAWQEVKLLFSILDLRELVICMLAIIGGVRPGEIFALKWTHISKDSLDVQQRVYRGKVDSPKTRRSLRRVALSEGLRSMLARWRSLSIDTSPEAWVFPSETLKTPLSKDNCWRRHIQPKLENVGLGWVNFHVMRRTHSSLMRELNVDPKVVADQLGHTLDVNLNVYTQTDLRLRKDAVDALETALMVH
ncbi:site-specific integrase [Acidobacteria bacterium AH-259-L09]|nr:site-specific integrase [Acidobacteria bacterium AH-259-L09]